MYSCRKAERLDGATNPALAHKTVFVSNGKFMVYVTKSILCHGLRGGHHGDGRKKR